MQLRSTTVRRRLLAQFLWGLIGCCVLFGSWCGAKAALTLSTPLVRSGRISFSCDAPTNQLITMQSADSMAGQWIDVTNHIGTAAVPIVFTALILEDRRFFRVSLTTIDLLDIFPNSPIMPEGAVSLPDAEIGSSYDLTLSPSGTGFPPYYLQVTGTPPDGIALTVSSNGTERASVQVHASGSGLVANQRRRFALTVVDGLNSTRTRNFDVRVIAGAPDVAKVAIVLKAGEPTQTTLTASGGTEPLTWSLRSGTLPAGILLSAEGIMTGTPTADAAELNEVGRYTNQIEVADSLTDRVTGLPSPRKATFGTQILVRLSYSLNLQPARPGGPSIRDTCLVCHGSGFHPDFDAPPVVGLIRVSSGSGGRCGTSQRYVVPGDVSTSLIYEKVSAAPPCGDRMPQFGPYLSDQRFERLARWIRELTDTDTD